MAKGRMLSRSISTSEKLLMLYDVVNDIPMTTNGIPVGTGENNSLGEFAQLLYTWIIPHTDDYGRMDASSRILKLKVMPGSNRSLRDFELALNAMQKVGLILLYNNYRHLEITDFENHQTFRSDRTRRKEYPDPTEDDICHTTDIPVGDNGIPMVSHKLSEVKLSEVKKRSSSGCARPNELIELESVAEKLYQQKIFPKVYAFVNTCTNKKQNIKAIVHSLNQCLDYYIRNGRHPPGNVWAYCNKIVQVENGNYNERENVQQHEDMKQFMDEWTKEIKGM